MSPCRLSVSRATQFQVTCTTCTEEHGNPARLTELGRPERWCEDTREAASQADATADKRCTQGVSGGKTSPEAPRARLLVRTAGAHPTTTA